MLKTFVPNYGDAMDHVPPGWYPVIATDVTSYTSKANTPCIKIINQVTDGEYEGRRLTLIFPLSGKATGFLRQFIRIFKPDYYDGAICPDDFLNKPFKVKVAKSTYSGGVRSYLKITPYPADYAEPMSEVDIQGGAQ